MPKNTVYLEAPERTQDLLNLKWTLRSAGYTIGSTWHEGEAITSLLPFRDHWNATSVGQLQICDSLVVICTAEDFGKHILQQTDDESIASDAQLAA